MRNLALRGEMSSIGVKTPPIIGVERNHYIEKYSLK
jgi:hypothetical protein